MVGAHRDLPRPFSLYSKVICHSPTSRCHKKAPPPKDSEVVGEALLGLVPSRGASCKGGHPVIALDAAAALTGVAAELERLCGNVLSLYELAHPEPPWRVDLSI